MKRKKIDGVKVLEKMGIRETLAYLRRKRIINSSWRVKEEKKSRIVLFDEEKEKIRGCQGWKVKIGGEKERGKTSSR